MKQNTIIYMGLNIFIEYLQSGKTAEQGRTGHLYRIYPEKGCVILLSCFYLLFESNCKRTHEPGRPRRAPACVPLPSSRPRVLLPSARVRVAACTLTARPHITWGELARIVALHP